MLRGFDLAAMGLNSAASLHLNGGRPMNLAYLGSQRPLLGDPASWAMPLEKLLSSAYPPANARIQLNRHTPSLRSRQQAPGLPGKAPTPPTSR